jgi:hypothetical protein
VCSFYLDLELSRRSFRVYALLEIFDPRWIVRLISLEDEEVEDTGIEPVTSSLQSWRSPS